MFGIFKKLFRKPSDSREGWLKGTNPDHYELLKNLQKTGLINSKNFICLLQDPETKQYWIEHVIDAGEGFWCEYQPISEQAALDLKSNSALFQEYVLHPWVKSDEEKLMGTSNYEEDSEK